MVAGILQLIFQLAPLAAIKKIPLPEINFKNPGVKKFFILILPALVAGGIAQINLLVDTIFASLLVTGSPTWLYVSDPLIQFPMGILPLQLVQFFYRVSQKHILKKILKILFHSFNMHLN